MRAGAGDRAAAQEHVEAAVRRTAASGQAGGPAARGGGTKAARGLSWPAARMAGGPPQASQWTDENNRHVCRPYAHLQYASYTPLASSLVSVKHTLWRSFIRAAPVLLKHSSDVSAPRSMVSGLALRSKLCRWVRRSEQVRTWQVEARPGQGATHRHSGPRGRCEDRCGAACEHDQVTARRSRVQRVPHAPCTKRLPWVSADVRGRANGLCKGEGPCFEYTSPPHLPDMNEAAPAEGRRAVAAVGLVGQPAVADGPLGGVCGQEEAQTLQAGRRPGPAASLLAAHVHVPRPTSTPTSTSHVPLAVFQPSGQSDPRF